MKAYLTYGPIALLLVWLYLLYGFIKSLKEFQKQTGIKPFSFQGYQFLYSRDKNEIEKSAMEKLKAQNARSGLVWIISVVSVFVIGIIIGIMTAKKD